ncbi:HNH endonuclease [Methylobacterium oxalidis]|uniref:HNH endonuclease n=1 Tax=Methylobacterium oxalidis TaxID=944322 RepID=UPI0035A24586
MEVDHEDGDGLNNRRGNLRHVTHTENLQAAFQRRREREFDAWFEEQMQKLSDESRPKILQKPGRLVASLGKVRGKTPTKTSWCGQEDSNLHPSRD